MIQNGEIYLKKLYRLARQSNNNFILGRFACLGQAVINKLELRENIFNHQKSRIDYLLRLSLSKQNMVKPFVIRKELARPYVYGCIEQQVYDFFNYKQPKSIIMDSFSELTDQLFVHKQEGWCFLANYTDIGHSEEFTDSFECLGLLDENQLEQNYIDFFDKLKKTYNKTTIFIHFPTMFDDREKFKTRGKLIVQILSYLEKKYDFLHSIHVEDNYVKKSVSDSEDLKDFPYHFSDETHEIFAAKVKAILKP